MPDRGLLAANLLISNAPWLLILKKSAFILNDDFNNWLRTWLFDLLPCGDVARVLSSCALISTLRSSVGVVTVNGSLGPCNSFVRRTATGLCLNNCRHFMGWSRLGAALSLFNSNVCKTATCCQFLFCIWCTSVLRCLCDLLQAFWVIFATHLQLIQIRSSFYPYPTNSV